MSNERSHFRPSGLELADIHGGNSRERTDTAMESSSSRALVSWPVLPLLDLDIQGR